MSPRLHLSAHDRLLVLAPHPDDESLGSGGLIHAAREAGARVSVVFGTDGDNNPWPQRWAEKRWRIGPDERTRWAARRRGEALRALALLGVDPEAATFFGWPDGGITDALIAGAAGTLVERLAQHLKVFAPTVVTGPSLVDTHPDHSALRLLLAAALRRSGIPAPAVFEYRIHGGAQAGGESFALSSARLQVKRDAVLCHATQAQFGTGRLLRFVRPTEHYRLAVPVPAPRDQGWRHIVLGRFARLRGVRLLLAGCTSGGDLRVASAVVPRLGAWTTLREAGEGRVLGDIDIAPASDGTRIEFVCPWDDLVEAYVKVERCPRGPVVFDAGGWEALAAQVLVQADEESLVAGR